MTGGGVRHWGIAGLSVLAFAWSTGGAQAARNQTELVSRASGAAGSRANSISDMPKLSDDGRFVAFTSAATNLSSDDPGPDQDWDVYVRDMQTGTTVLVSRASGAAGVKGNDLSLLSAISADGRFVVFESQASNLSPDDRDTEYDVYVRDMQTSTTVLVSRASGAAGTKGNGRSGDAAISADGRFVAFESLATNLSPDGYATSAVFVRDLQANTTTLVSGGSGGIDPAISADGRFVAFSALGSLDPVDTDGAADVYVRDLQAGTATLVSRASGAGGAKANDGSHDPSVSGDGRFVAFESSASNLSPDDAGTHADVFVRDLQMNTTSLVSRTSATVGGAIGNRDSVQPELSRDGRFVAFVSRATNLDIDDNDDYQDVFVRDLGSRTTGLVSRASGARGAKGYLDSREAVLSGDGSFVAFTSRAPNLSPDDPDAGDDVFRRQLLGNTAPVTAADTYAAAQDTLLRVFAPGVLGNDSDPDGDSVRALLVSGPAHGTLELRDDGGFDYTPGAGYHGADSFTYKATDGALESPSVPVTITVNAPPVGVADAYTTEQNRLLSVNSPGVLENDSDPDGAPLHAKLVSEPVWGTVELRAQGGFDYTPLPGFYGVESFTYRATDGALDSPAVTVTITVNAAPVAAPDAFTTAEGTRLSVAAPGVLGNDSDPDGDPLRAFQLSLPAHGTLDLAGDGGFSYTPAAGYHGSDSFTYKALDDADRLASPPVTVTITVNARPVAAPDAYSMAQGRNLSVPAPGVLGNDSDADGDPLRALLVSGPAHGTLELAGDGGFSYAPAAGFHGSDSFTYKAVDDDDGPALPAVTVTISVNGWPVTAPDAYAAAEGTRLTVAAPGVLGNDSDPEGDPLRAVRVSAPAHGTLDLGADGGLSYTPDTGYHGSDSFTYRAVNDDDRPASPAVTVTITVNPQPPSPSPSPPSSPPSVMPAANPPRCMGRDATIVGTSGADVLRGTPRADVIVAHGGIDLVHAGGGNDVICAGSGDDRVEGGAGHDRLFGGPGKDRLFGGLGRDGLFGGPGRDRMTGGPGRDRSRP